MKRKLCALCLESAFMLLSLSGCTYKDDSSVKSYTSQDAKATALQYMQDKYGLDCIAVNSDVYAPELMGESYYKVLMRPSDDPEGEALKEKEGQSYLNLSNNDQKYGSTFAVFIDVSDGSIIGDQYMWYNVYPIFNSWMKDKLLQFTPNQVCCIYLQFNTTVGPYEYCFSQDFSIISTAEELEDQLSWINFNIWAYYPESPDKNMTQNDWTAFGSQMQEHYTFNCFNMTIHEVSYSIYQRVVSDVTAYRSIPDSEFVSWQIRFGKYFDVNSDV